MYSMWDPGWVFWVPSQHPNSLPVTGTKEEQGLTAYVTCPGSPFRHPGTHGKRLIFGFSGKFHAYG